MSNVSITLRSAQPEEAPALTACIDAAYQSYRDAGIDLPPVADGIAEDIRDNHVWLVEDAQGIAGGAILLAGPEGAKLANIAVHPNRVGQGIGKVLMNHVLNAAKALGHSQITLVTHRLMPDNIALYQHLGWAITDRTDDKVTMSRGL
ncbi:GNAT family N-acetyltransferase [Roseovarius sp. 2305UL8-3]|uniref:GNAT family N-acetyltransferase n=1 Tax=Roseovarius conchicola TaxID=3121636 RepID=UPI003528F3BD